MMPKFPVYEPKYKDYIEKIYPAGEMGPFKVIGYTPIMSDEERHDLIQETAKVAYKIQQQLMRDKVI